MIKSGLGFTDSDFILVKWVCFLSLSLRALCNRVALDWTIQTQLLRFKKFGSEATSKAGVDYKDGHFKRKKETETGEEQQMHKCVD